MSDDDMPVGYLPLIAALGRALEYDTAEYWNVVAELERAFPNYAWHNALTDGGDSAHEPFSSRLARQAREASQRPYMDPLPVRTLLTDLADAVERLQEERDQAIAHDRQPYPTAEAYELACAALERKRARIADLEDGMRDLAEQLERGGLRRTAMRLRVALEDDEELLGDDERER